MLILLPLLVLRTASRCTYKYHWSVGTLRAKGYTNIQESIFPALQRLPSPSVRSEEKHKESKSTHTPLGDTQVHLSQRHYARHLGENSAPIPRASPEVHTEQETVLIPSWLHTATAMQWG